MNGCWCGCSRRSRSAGWDAAGRQARNDHAADEQPFRVTYTGFPLYRFAGDTKSGQVNGQGLEQPVRCPLPRAPSSSSTLCPQRAASSGAGSSSSSSGGTSGSTGTSSGGASGGSYSDDVRLRARLLDRVAEMRSVSDRIGATLGEDPAQRPEEPRPRDLLALEGVSRRDRLHRCRVRDVPLSGSNGAGAAAAGSYASRR